MSTNRGSIEPGRSSIVGVGSPRGAMGQPSDATNPTPTGSSKAPNSFESVTATAAIGSNKDAASRRVLETALEEVLESIATGCIVNREALMAKYPEVAMELDECVRNLDFIQTIAPQLADDPVAQPLEEREKNQQHARLGDFRIIQEIGRGGMGVVYEAQQISLNRCVALKVLPLAGMLDSRRLARFRHEAQAAALLRHPNIVSVFSVGCDRGVHYYAMDFIEGPSLAQILEGTRPASKISKLSVGVTTAQPETLVDTRALAALSTLRMEQPAECFRAAARIGIQAAEALHYAHQMGVVHRDIKPSNLLVDGEAHLWITDFGLAMTQENAGLTITGDILGTLRYMSPEQAAGKRLPLDHRTDIYSLGITLYELISGRPAFEGTDRGELLRNVTEVDPPLLRVGTPNVPIDLETIVHKAIAKDPPARYGSAQELALDLHRFLTGQPILARRPTRIDRLLKWTRRRAGLVAAVSVVLFLATIGLAVGLGLLSAANRQTQLHRRQSEANLHVAAEAVDRLLLDLAQEAKSHGDLPFAKRFLDQALSFYDRLSNDSTNQDILLRAARAHGQASQIQDLIGNEEQSTRLEEHALSLLDRIDSVGRQRSDVLQFRAEALANIGMNDLRIGVQGDGEAKMAGAIEIWEELLQREAENVHARKGLVRTLNALGILYSGTGRLARAEEAWMRALRLATPLTKQSTSLEILSDTSAVKGSLGLLADHQRDYVKGERLFRESLQDAEKVLASKPNDPEYQNDVLIAHENLAELFVHRGDHAAACQAVREMVQRFPKQLMTYWYALQVLSQCVAAASGDTSHDSGKTDAIVAEYRAMAREIIEQSETVKQRPATPVTCLAWQLVRGLDRAIWDPPRALRLADAAIAEAPDRSWPHEVRGAALYRLGKYDEAIKALDFAKQLDDAADNLLVDDELFRAMASWQLGQKEQARASYDTALRMNRQLESQPANMGDWIAAVRPLLFAEAKGLIGPLIDGSP